MSMNIYIFAEQKVTFKKKNGARSGRIDRVNFDAWQTPTRVTRSILASKDPAQAYKDWILTECSADEVLPVYAIGDWNCEGEPVRYDTFNAGKEHVAEFESWLAMVDEEGYTLRVEER